MTEPFARLTTATAATTSNSPARPTPSRGRHRPTTPITAAAMATVSSIPMRRAVLSF